MEQPTEAMNVEDGVSTVAPKGDKMLQMLLEAGIPREDAVAYVNLFITHEVDESILSSTLLNQGHLKDLGITKMGHIIKYV
jgi:hypothetical protein